MLMDALGARAPLSSQLARLSKMPRNFLLLFSTAATLTRKRFKMMSVTKSQVSWVCSMESTTEAADITKASEEVTTKEEAVNTDGTMESIIRVLHTMAKPTEPLVQFFSFLS